MNTPAEVKQIVFEAGEKLSSAVRVQRLACRFQTCRRASSVGRTT
jgi:hypothetical protein